MNPQLIFVFALLAICITAFILNKPRMDAVALFALLALVLGGVLDMKEALAGFSEPSVILIAAFFVIGEGLVQTGVALRVGDWLVKTAGSSEKRLLILLMLAVAFLGSVMSSTGVVALFIPVALGIAGRLEISPGKIMMPLAFAGLISGMLTLVGTPPNMVVSGELVRAGYKGFSFFAFTPAGLIVLALGVVYMLFSRHKLAGKTGEEELGQRRRFKDLVDEYQIQGHAARLQIPAGSPMAGQTLTELKLRHNYGVNIIAIERERHFRTAVLTPTPNRELRADDVVVIEFTPVDDCLNRFIADMGLINLDFRSDLVRELGLAELLVPPDSSLIGKTILQLRMRSRYNINVMGLKRKGKALGVDGTLLDEKLKMGDTLLIAGTWKAIRLLQTRPLDFLVLDLPAEIEESAPASRQAPFALLTLMITIGLMISGLVPNVIAALLGCMLLGFFRCIDMDSAYRSIHWQSLILIVGMLPFAVALEKTGGIELLVTTLLDITGDASPRIVMAALFVMTSVVGLFISNTATAVLMAPIGIGVAQKMAVSPYPFAMTVALAASAAFMTPVSSPVNTLVLAPGNYRFIDFVKIGVPFTILVLLVCVALLPILFPL